MLSLEVWSLPIHSLKKCLYHILVKFEQNCMVQTTRNVGLFDRKTKQNKTKRGFLKPFLTKRWGHFGRCFYSWNSFMLSYQFEDYQCSKNYGSPTRVTRLKIAPNVADPISIKDTDSHLKGGSRFPDSKILVCYRKWGISIIKNCDILALKCVCLS